MNKIIKIDWKTFERMLARLIEKIDKKNFDTVIGISRGGLPLAVKLSYRLKIRDFQVLNIKRSESDVIGASMLKPQYKDGFLDVEKKNVLLVDSLIGTGDTIKLAKKILLENGANQVYVLSLFKWNKNKDEVNNYVEILKNDDWVIFPWE
ncbi:MAG: phosphoribosyltransferase [Nanoarchaeota archaeon]|nr:phosphoribosyltransferase [Nanoarchaeota archaeon]